MKKFVVLTIFCACAACFLLCGCQPSLNDREPETTVPDLILYSEPESATFAVVRPQNSSATIIKAASALARAYQALGVDTKLYDEYSYVESTRTHAVYIGVMSESRATDQQVLDTCAQFYSELRYDDFMIRASGGDLFIMGGSEAATVEGVQYFTENYLERTQFPGDYCLRALTTYDLPDLKLNGVEISQYCIIYDGVSSFSAQRAKELQTLILKKTGYQLPVKQDSAAEVPYEILIGQTKMELSQTLLNEFTDLRVCYTIAAKGTKLALASDGIRTAVAAQEEMEALLNDLTAENCDLTESNLLLRKDIAGTVDPKMYERKDGTDLRVMFSNILNVTGEGNDNGYSPKQRAELLADTYLIYLPDVITFNEFMDRYEVVRYLWELLEPYYVLADIRDESSEVENIRNGDIATKIAYRKDIGMKEIDSGIAQLIPEDSFHTVSWALLETADGNRFIAASGHYIENRDENKQWVTTYVKIATDMVEQVKNTYGDLPVIINGDWWFWQKTPPYQHMTDCGYSDASVSAENCYSIGVGTYHIIGSSAMISTEDLCFYTADHLTALAHRGILNTYTINASDHLPILVDYRFIS